MSDLGYHDWMKAKQVAAQFLRDLLPDAGRPPEREDALTSALFARLAHAELLTVSLAELRRLSAGETLLRGLVGADDKLMAGDWGLRKWTEETGAIIADARALLGGGK